MIGFIIKIKKKKDNFKKKKKKAKFKKKKKKFLMLPKQLNK